MGELSIVHVGHHNRVGKMQSVQYDLRGIVRVIGRFEMLECRAGHNRAGAASAVDNSAVHELGQGLVCAGTLQQPAQIIRITAADPDNVFACQFFLELRLATFVSAYVYKLYIKAVALNSSAIIYDPLTVISIIRIGGVLDEGELDISHFFAGKFRKPGNMCLRNSQGR